ncbi:MAG: DoxX family protein [Candidatus Eremiobacteraeota bacterium]|nr:DoxX family protein [Candidatus Eremiobacteraeota bacterium]
MNALFVAVPAATILANAGAGFADLAKAKFVLKTSTEVGVPRSWLPGLAGLKLAGAAGLLLGLLGVPVIQTAAAAGLVLYFIGALIAHARAGVFYNIAFPGFYFCLALASLLLSRAR